MGCSKVNNKNCGCASSALKTPQSCNEHDCYKEPCSEMFSDECIIHIQKDMHYTSDKGKKMSLRNGDRLMAVLQKLMVLSVSDKNIDSDNIPSDLRVEYVNDNSISVSWDVMNKQMSLQYKAEEQVTWDNDIDVSNVDSYIIQNLAPNTVYNIRLVNQDDNVDSIIITVKTKY